MTTCFKFLNCEWAEIFNPSVSRRCQKLIVGNKQEAAVDERTRKKNAFLRRLARKASAVRQFEDDFTIGNEIGSGSFATVYKAHSKHSEVPDRAVKVINLTGAEKDMIANELHTLLLLDHPHVLAFHSWYETSRDIKLVTELCYGTLADIRTPQALEIARPIFRSIFSALAYAHARDFLHRDIKPQNVLFTENGTVKVADWGLSIRLIDGQAPKTTQGTLYYLAPEALIEPFTSSFEADVWSTGVMLYMFMHDYHPFLPTNEKKVRVSYRRVLCSPSLVPHPIRSMDDDMSSLITECLTVDPTKRPTALACWKSPALQDRVIELAPSGRACVQTGPLSPHSPYCVDGKYSHPSSPARSSSSSSSSDSESTTPSVNDEGGSPRMSVYGRERAFASGAVYARNTKLSATVGDIQGKTERWRSDESNRFGLRRSNSCPLTPKKRGVPTIVETLQNYCRTLDKTPTSDGSEEAKAVQDATCEELLYYDTEAYFEYYMQAVNERGVLEVVVDGKTYVLAYSEFVHAMSGKVEENIDDGHGGIRERSVAARYFPTLQEVEDLRRTINLRATAIPYAPELLEQHSPELEVGDDVDEDIRPTPPRATLKAKIKFDFPTLTTIASGQNNADSVSDPDSPAPTVVTPTQF